MDHVKATMLQLPALPLHFAHSLEYDWPPSCCMKMSSVVPIPTDGDTSVPNNYRPISLLSIVSKLLERCIHGKVMKHLCESHPLTDHQWGFRPGTSNTHALLSATIQWFGMLGAGVDVGGIFFHLSYGI